ncbi:hypothetical protein D3C87_241690 [compost metagenome]
MKEAEILKKITDDLVGNFSCHTIVLYGSRARGDHSESSDYDILGVTDSTDKTIRHAYVIADQYVDGFVYSTQSLMEPDQSHLYMKDGKVLREREGFGTKLLESLEQIYRKGPSISSDELEMKRVWAQKMIDRAQRGDNEGNYRKHWLIYALLEDYFAFRGLWYEGAKKALEYLKVHDPEVLMQFEAVFASPHDLLLLQRLKESIVR